MKRFLIVLVCTLLCAMPPAGARKKPVLHRVFATDRFDIDRILSRPYDSEVPFGASGDRVWATSPQGWAFREGIQLLYVTNLNVFDLDIRVDGQKYVVGQATYFPSHVHLQGRPGVERIASASFTYITDRVENPLTRPFRPEKRWTCWSSGQRSDWYAVHLGVPQTLTGLELYFFDDQPTGGCAPPESVQVELYRDGRWVVESIQPFTPSPGKNVLRFTAGRVERVEQIRLTFQHRGTDRYTGLYGFEPLVATQDTPQDAPLRPDVTVEADKWITQEDVLVARVTLRNHGKTPCPVALRMISPFSETAEGFEEIHRVADIPLYLIGGGTDGRRRAPRFVTDLPPGQTRHFTFACAVARAPDEARGQLRRTLTAPDPLRAHVRAYQAWFDQNIARFECSDPHTTKMYYHRWYLLKKNSMRPRMGALRHRTFAEGRWTAEWYANVISYGAPHQIREARWLRDPSYAWGHLQTWTENPGREGIFPSHVTPRGAQGGQYTDWIGATAWDVYLVHPDRSLLARVADPVARNAQGWRRVYGWDNSPLLVVDSHWWTGMEWQPSFFAFAGHQTGGGDGTDRKFMTPLRRVDLTAYNFGNAQAAARIYRELGRDADAATMQTLAEETRRALLEQMWNPQTKWFHSLRAQDNALSPDKEIIGLYPFYFQLPPAHQGYEAAWEIALDPKFFWTPWPVASTSRDCPAYAQNGWPVGPGGSGCMWNGPTWPHANSLVLTAMIHTLRHYAPCALTRQKLYELFLSYTRAQFRDQDPTYPWTGEYYNGDTGQWKTDQRDYNHSTWIDPLITGLIGLVPRPDSVLEVDPLLPEGTWDYYVLDGQHYRGHTVTIAYDAQGGRIAPGFRGYAVFLDGKEVFRASRPVRMRYDIEKRTLVKEAEAQRGGTATLTVLMTGFRSMRGRAQVALFRSAMGFPNNSQQAFRTEEAPIVNGVARVTFTGLPFGEYAVAARHDENNDGRLNRNALGMPTEGYGFSNNARNPFGPPPFGAARFLLNTAELQIEVRIRY
ncbi:MAG: DUF2141 domain-containing protein [Chloroherpetonaceae bacterium]|nr:DUF2141 domain-containing protein [Chthonomonadaceae bacterium]MDW8208322.1 DUF2141 domain-containing protein [Chloroherpetonaceae bacterium]